jgi:LCP family protein required for cell wall assembly
MSTLEPQLHAGAVRSRRRRRLAVRMLAGCLIVIAAVAATVATGTLLEVKFFTDALKQSPRLNLGSELATANAGGPQTLLLIGSDKRAKGAIDASSPPHSDTMLLVRLDPSQPDTTMLSIPRDLKVRIHPNKGPSSTQKINAAYSIGGAKLAVKTVKQVLGIKINHVIDINFGGFKALVDYLGCVFVQVDRRYYHSNLGLAPSETYSEIDIQPGYQKLCGQDALSYVRYRHTDDDLVRAARQQDFLRQIKNQVGAAGLVARRHAIEQIFGKYASTDIRSTDDVLKLLELVVQSASHPVRQVTFDASIGPSYVTANRAQVRRTVRLFLHGGGKPVPVAASPPGAGTSTRKHHLEKPAAKPNTNLVPASADELAQAHATAPKLPFRLYYPADRVPGLGSTSDTIRDYRLEGHPAYVVVVSQGGLGQFYDLEGTTWQGAPILRNPNQTVTVSGRRMQLYYEGQRLRVVAWHAGGAVYWLTNTLQNLLTNRQMLAVAAAAKPVS